MKNPNLTNEQIKAIIETYYQFPTKGITIEMLKAARIASGGVGLGDCKRILKEHIDKMSKII